MSVRWLVMMVKFRARMDSIRSSPSSKVHSIPTLTQSLATIKSPEKHLKEDRLLTSTHASTISNPVNTVTNSTLKLTANYREHLKWINDVLLLPTKALFANLSSPAHNKPLWIQKGMSKSHSLFRMAKTLGLWQTRLNKEIWSKAVIATPRRLKSANQPRR